MGDVERVLAILDLESSGARHATDWQQARELADDLSPAERGRALAFAAPTREFRGAMTSRLLESSAERGLELDPVQAAVVISAAMNADQNQRWINLRLVGHGLREPTSDPVIVDLVSKIAARVRPDDVDRWAALALVAPSSAWFSERFAAKWYRWHHRLVEEVLASDAPDLRALRGAIMVWYAGKADPAELLKDREALLDEARAFLIDADHVVSDALGDPGYRGERLFDPAARRAIVLAGRLAMFADTEWAPQILGGLFSRLVHTPPSGTSIPEEAVARDLVTSLGEAPTPELVDAFSASIHQMDDPVLRKRFSRRIAIARRRLPHRPEVALRVPTDAVFSRTRRRMFLLALEGQLITQARWSAQQWNDQLRVRPETVAVADDLIWVLHGPNDARSVVWRLASAPQDASGAVAPITYAHVSLWHPRDASPEERAVWRATIAKARVEQPIRQAFREFYGGSPGLLDLEGVVVDVRVLLAVANSQGWKLVDLELEKRFGPARVRIGVGEEMHGGLEGPYPVTAVTVLGQDFDELNEVTASEVLRSIDLLLSVSALEHDAGRTSPDALREYAESPGGAVAVRRIVIESLHDGDPRVRVEDRWVHVGDVAVNLATGRTRRGGEIVEHDAPVRRRAFVPHREKTLLRILDIIDAELARA